MRTDLVVLRSLIYRVERLAAEWRQDVVDAAASGDTGLARRAVSAVRLHALRRAFGELREDHERLSSLVEVQADELDLIRAEAASYPPERPSALRELVQTVERHDLDVMRLQVRVSSLGARVGSPVAPEPVVEPEAPDAAFGPSRLRELDALVERHDRDLDERYIVPDADERTIGEAARDRDELVQPVEPAPSLYASAYTTGDAERIAGEVAAREAQSALDALALGEPPVPAPGLVRDPTGDEWRFSQFLDGADDEQPF
jgi:hypothetical protein